MLRTFRADLHLHTCLSPCGEEEMTPLAIVRQAKKKGLDVIGICDHNSTKNVVPVRRAERVWL
jgi:predicted metal-dependent phosphoesterase TrpH